MSLEHRLRLAMCGLHPDRARLLRQRHGDAGSVIARMAAGIIDAPARVRTMLAQDREQIGSTLDRLGVSPLFRGDPGYPRHLGELPDAPDVLFTRGRLPIEPGVAIVGTRRCTAYGQGVADEYGRAVAEAGWPVVSGLARGIDGAAHQGTVRAGGRGIGVLGSGIDVLYPREHVELAGRIVELGGCIISEYPPGTPPEGWRFPTRNRIISGLAAVVVIVEAPATGGALITARYALDHDRAVFATPGDVDRVTSEGCNLLIRDGALPVLAPDDLVEALQFVPGLEPPVATAISRRP